MAKIITDVTLKDVLRYKGQSYVNRFGSKMNLIGFNFPSQTARELARIALSDINKGAFDRYKKGHFEYCEDITFDKLKAIGDQESWFKSGVAGFKSSSTTWVRVYDGTNLWNSWAIFYFNDDRAYGNPIINLNQVSACFKEDRVRDILAPLIASNKLEGVVKAVMANPAQAGEKR